MALVGVSVAMPRGGGHFGGHHHGGGGGGGHGGHHHHHHHHRPYRSGVVFVGWWSGPGYYRRRPYLGFALCWVVFFLVIIAVILSTSLVTVNDNKDDSDDNGGGFDTQYAPLETRRIDVSQTFCDGIELENPSHQMPATAYVLSKGPSLTDEHNYTISESNVTIGGNSYQYWNYYLNHGSSMNASICVKSGNGVEFYIIQGSKSFEHWQDGEDSFIKFKVIGTFCPSTVPADLEFVDKTDDYFFAYASLGGTVIFDTNMTFHRKEFGIIEQDVEHRCEAGGEYSKKCTVSIPYNDEHYFLLATGNTTSSKGDEDGASVSWTCKARVWVYILAFLLPALFGIILITTVCAICCIYKRRRNSSYARLGDDAASAAALTTGTTYVTTTTTTPAPPPQPVKDVGPPPYSTATAPQGGYYGQTAYPPAPQAGYSEQQPYPPTHTYPPMPQPAPYPPMAQNYGTVDNKP